LPASNTALPKKFRKQPDFKKNMPIPPLPPVQSEAALAIFAHSSLKSLVLNDNFGDADRLAFIGRQVLSMAVADVLFEKRPMLSAVELEVWYSWLPYIQLIDTALSRMLMRRSRSESKRCRTPLTTSG
jgi:hypothetical protein